LQFEQNCVETCEVSSTASKLWCVNLGHADVAVTFT